MTTQAFLQSRWTRWLLGLAFWTLLGLAFAGQLYISASVPWKEAVTNSLEDWYVFAALSMAVVWLSRRSHFEGGKWGRSLAIHLLGSIAFSLSYMAVRAGIASWQSGRAFPEAFQVLLLKVWPYTLLIYWVIVAVNHAFEYYRKYREREMRALDLEKRLAQAKLQ